jgi:hypothetical protein
MRKDHMGEEPPRPEDTETPSHQRAEFNDRLAGGDPTAPGAPNEPGGIAFNQSSRPGADDELDLSDDNKRVPGERHPAG